MHNGTHKAIHYCRLWSSRVLFDVWFVWVFTSFCTCFPSFCLILHELFWMNKSHWSFHSETFLSPRVQRDQSEQLGKWLPELSSKEPRFSLWSLIGKPFSLNHLISSVLFLLLPNNTVCSSLSFKAMVKYVLIQCTCNPSKDSILVFCDIFGILRVLNTFNSVWKLTWYK